MTTIIRNPSACCGGGKRIRGTVVDPGGGLVSRTAATFQIENLSNVFGTATLPSAPLTVHQIFQQGYIAGQPTEAIWNETTNEWDNLPDPIKLGCHLNVDAYGFIFVTPQTLAGSGLSYSTGTGPGGCDQLTATGTSLTAGCGIQIVSSVISVDTSQLVGDGLQIVGGSGQCKMTINYGCGLIIDSSTHKLIVNTSQLVGDGLQIVGGSGQCAMKVKTGDGITIDSNHAVSVKHGCGLTIDSNKAVAVNPSDLAGCGLKVASDDDDPTPCQLVIDLDALVGDGSKGLAKNTGDTDTGAGPCQLKVNPNETIHDITGCLLEIDNDGVIKLHLQYRSIQVYGIVGTTGEYECELGAVVCGETTS